MKRITTKTGSIAYARYQLQRSILESSLGNDFTKADKAEAMRYFGGCAYCGKKPARRMDHLISVMNNGDFIRANVVPACQKCDDSKGKKDYNILDEKFNFSEITSKERLEQN